MQINNKNLTSLQLNNSNINANSVKKAATEETAMKKEKCDTVELSSKEIKEIEDVLKDPALKDKLDSSDSKPCYAGFFGWLGRLIGGKVGEKIGRLGDIVAGFFLPFMNVVNALWDIFVD